MPRCSASEFTDSFIAVMLQDLEQTTQEETGESLDLSRDDIDAETLQRIARDCREFYIANETHIHAKDACLREGTYNNGYYSAVDFAGSDLYMTWVGHGVGFWDSTCWTAEHGQPMSDYVDGMGHFEGAYLGDDKRVYTA